jgi:hypothetical protein
MWVYTNTLTRELNRYRPDQTGPDRQTHFKSFQSIDGLDFLGGLGRKYGGTLLNSDLHTTPVDNLSLPTKLTHVC